MMLVFEGIQKRYSLLASATKREQTHESLRYMVWGNRQCNNAGVLQCVQLHVLFCLLLQACRACASNQVPRCTNTAQPVTSTNIQHIIQQPSRAAANAKQTRAPNAVSSHQFPSAASRTSREALWVLKQRSAFGGPIWGGRGVPVRNTTTTLCVAV